MTPLNDELSSLRRHASSPALASHTDYSGGYTTSAALPLGSGAMASAAKPTSGGTPVADGKSSFPPSGGIHLPPVNLKLSIEDRPAEVRRIAIELFPQTDNWVIFYREILAGEGVASQLFTTPEQRLVWELSDEFIEVHMMLSAMRTQDTGKGDTCEPMRMITVRLPASLHEALKDESTEQELSINKLCITKLLHKVDPRYIPEELGKRRGRKPGPQGKRLKKLNG